MTAANLTVAQFLKDVAKHQLTIIRDDGVYRHLRFAEPGTGCMHFDLITWPGYLCYTGDMGTFVFQRIRDMLEFFRPSERASEDPFKWIDRRYWAEKVEASDRDGVKEFDEDIFKRRALECLVEWIRRNRSNTDKTLRRELWDDAISSVIHTASEGEHAAFSAAYNFSFRVNGRDVNPFSDFWENNCNRWTSRFEWCCFALRWGVMTYDKAKAEAAALPEVQKTAQEAA